MTAYFYWDPRPEAFFIPLLDFPVLWYGVFFAIGFWLGFLVFVKILADYFELTLPHRRSKSNEIKKRAQGIADRLTIYIILGAIIGARLGHFLFYEHPADYLKDPLELFLIRHGGLASHGAIIGIILAAILFSAKIRKQEPALTWVRILDFLVAPAALAGAFIRIGNFFNQEILGVATQLPWGVIFGHPVDHGFPVPRHPVQIYEAIWYFFVFYFLWRLHRRVAFFLHPGKMVGLFLILAFGFRFLIEFLKVEQSRLLSTFDLTMGQLLSIPVVIFGIIVYTWRGPKG